MDASPRWPWLSGQGRPGADRVRWQCATRQLAAGGYRDVAGQAVAGLSAVFCRVPWPHPQGVRLVGHAGTTPRGIPSPPREDRPVMRLTDPVRVSGSISKTDPLKRREIAGLTGVARMDLSSFEFSPQEHAANSVTVDARTAGGGSPQLRVLPAGAHELALQKRSAPLDRPRHPGLRTLLLLLLVI